MKGMRSAIPLVIIAAFIAIGINTASAAENIYVNATMPYDTIYQGEVVSANVTVKNNDNSPVRIYSIGVHYDWMYADEASHVDFGGNYVQVEPNGVSVPGQFPIPCDISVSSGYHSFYYNVNLSWYDSYNNTWVNDIVVQPGTIYIETPKKPEALQELQFANITLSNALSTNFTSKKGKEDMHNAADTLSDGWNAYNASEYGRAINDSRRVVDDVGNAKIDEKNYLDNAIGIERIVLSVNDKLRSVTLTGDPATTNARNDALDDLNRTRQYLDAEDFVSALTYANLADHSADKAIQQQFYYLLKANDTETAKNSSRSALDAAQKSLDGAANMTSASSASMLSDARARMSDARLMYGQGDYANATIKANAISTLVSQANSDEASYRMMLAHNLISSAKDLRSAEAKELMANASREYNQSEIDYGASDYPGAIAHASEAIRLANDSAAADQKGQDKPTNTAIPGFEALTALLAIGAIFILMERKG